MSEWYASWTVFSDSYRWNCEYCFVDTVSVTHRFSELQSNMLKSNVLGKNILLRVTSYLTYTSTTDSSNFPEGTSTQVGGFGLLFFFFLLLLLCLFVVVFNLTTLCLKCTFEDVPLVEFIYLVFTRTPG